MADFIIVSEDTEIECHKFVLASKSPVFEAMLENNLEEVKEGKVKMHDVKVATVKLMLKYMYTGYISEDSTVMKDLLIAADKYQMGRLKSICEKKLIAQLKVNNVLENIVFAEKYNAKDLMKKAKTFLVENKQEVKKIPEWSKPLKDCNPEFVAKLFF